MKGIFVCLNNQIKWLNMAKWNISYSESSRIVYIVANKRNTEILIHIWTFYIEVIDKKMFIIEAKINKKFEN